MPLEPGWPERLWDYLSAIGIYWWVGLAVLVALERYVERLVPRFWNQNIDPWFTPTKRRKVLILFAALAFLFANFRAFDDRSDFARKVSLQLSRIQENRDAAPTRATRNPDSLYQLGEEVATVTGAFVNQGNSLVTFQAVRSAGKLDATREVEYRDFVLSCNGLPPAPPPNVIAGVVVSMSNGVHCSIVRRRAH